MSVSRSHVQTDKPSAASLTLLSERKEIAKQSFIDKYPAAIVTYDKLQAPTPPAPPTPDLMALKSTPRGSSPCDLS